jgi:hypothetical protein
LDIIYPDVPKPANLTPCKLSIPRWQPLADETA